MAGSATSSGGRQGSSHNGEGLRVGLVRSRFNDPVTRRLRDGARQALDACGVRENDRLERDVPGAVELALAAQHLITQHGVDAVVCLGAVIEGETRHFDYVCRMAADGIRDVSLRTGVPVAFGVLTCATQEQADARSAEDPQHNRGYDAALCAVEMARLLQTGAASTSSRSLEGESA